jgi:hypothetical protein
VNRRRLAPGSPAVAVVAGGRLETDVQETRTSSGRTDDLRMTAMIKVAEGGVRRTRGKSSDPDDRML